MRRHISMEQLAVTVLETARSSVREKNASAVTLGGAMQTELGRMLAKVASEIRNVQQDDLTYADIAAIAEVRRGQR